MIPIINVIASIYSMFVLKELSEIREALKDPNKAREALFREHYITPFEDEDKNKLMYEASELLIDNKEELFD